MLHLRVVKTDRLYYTDCYLSNFEARVTQAANGGCRLYLDQTAFYPASGGQPHDLGTLGGQAVLEVIDEEDRIAHVLAAPVSSEAVAGKIEWQRRYDHMQQHTGQHLLSAVLVELFGFQTVSFHMGGEVSTIELAAKELTDSQIDEAELRTNQIVREARPVNIRFEDAEAVQALRKPSARAGTLRIIEIEGLDRSACGGTHVRSTAELGPIQIRKLEKIRGNVRVEFVCGIRALRRAKQDFRLLAELSKQTAVAIEGLPEHVASLRQRLTEAEKARQRSALELARRDGEILYENTLPSADGLRRTLLRVVTIEETVRAKVQAFTARAKAVALVIAAEPPGVLIASSIDSQINAGANLEGGAFARRRARRGLCHSGTGEPAQSHRGKPSVSAARSKR